MESFLLGTIPGVHNGLDMTAGCNFWGGLREVCLVPYRMDILVLRCKFLISFALSLSYLFGQIEERC